MACKFSIRTVLFLFPTLLVAAQAAHFNLDVTDFKASPYTCSKSFDCHTDSKRETLQPRSVTLWYRRKTSYSYNQRS